MTSRNKTESDKGIALSGGRCIICGWDGRNFKGESLVVGAHVRSFKSGHEFDHSDNIIALCPNHHAEYDGYAFTIDSKTKKIIHIDPTNPINGLSVKDKIAHIQEKYLAYNHYHFNLHNPTLESVHSFDKSISNPSDPK